MKSRPSLKNSAKASLSFLIATCIICGCSSSTTPTYLIETIEQDIRNICKKEYKLEVKPKLVGSTLWIYIPLENIVEKSDKPQKYVEKFSIEQNNSEFENRYFKVDYLIKAVPEEEKQQEYKFKKEALESINNVWKVLRRVIFSMKSPQDKEPKFYYLIVADIKTGYEIDELLYYQDLKKVSYGFISWEEYQHRTIQDGIIAPQVIGDREGASVNYRDITLEEFICAQIKHRVRLKFQKPEVENKNLDLDKEISRIITYTIKTYGFRDFSAVEMNNLLTKIKTVLSETKVWAGALEQKF